MDGERTEKFSTSCKPCIFAQWEDGVQLDTCDLGRLEKYIARKQTTSHPDGYHVVDTICNACRGEEWMRNQLSTTDLVSQVQREIQIDMSFVLLSMGDGFETIMQLLPQRIHNVRNQKQIPAKQFIVVLQNDRINTRAVYDILNEECGDMPFRLVKVIEDRVDTARCVDLGVQYVTGRYYFVSYLQHNIPINMLKVFNTLVNVNLRQISMVEPVTEFSGLIIQTPLHKIFGGNRLMPLHQKIREAAELQNKTDSIATWEEIWNYHE